MLYKTIIRNEDKKHERKIFKLIIWEYHQSENILFKNSIGFFNKTKKNEFRLCLFFFF